jgi:hypothetical protein
MDAKKSGRALGKRDKSLSSLAARYKSLTRSQRNVRVDRPEHFRHLQRHWQILSNTPQMVRA